jgi:hypothetical protein
MKVIVEFIDFETEQDVVLDFIPVLHSFLELEGLGKFKVQNCNYIYKRVTEINDDRFPSKQKSGHQSYFLDYVVISLSPV